MPSSHLFSFLLSSVGWVPTTFHVPMSSLSSRRCELPPLVKTFYMASWALRDANDAQLAINYITCITTPKKTTHSHYLRATSFFRSPPPGSGSASPNVPIWQPAPHPLYSLRSHNNLKPCLSAGFRDNHILYIYGWALIMRSFGGILREQSIELEVVCVCVSATPVCITCVHINMCISVYTSYTSVHMLPHRQNRLNYLD